MASATSVSFTFTSTPSVPSGDYALVIQASPLGTGVGAGEGSFEGGDFLAGPYTYADVAFFMAQFFASFLGAPRGDGHPRLDDWSRWVRERAAVRRVIEPMTEFLRAAGIRAPLD